MQAAVMQNNVVEQALARYEGSLTELGSQLSKFVGREITRQRVFGWRMRGIFPRDIIPHVHRLLGIPMEEMLTAQPKKLGRGSVVDRAIERAGGTAAQFAAKLSKETGRHITRQMVNGWQAREQFPRDVVLDVHLLTKIPVADLMKGRRDE